MDKKYYLRPNMEVVEVLFQLPIATSGDGSGGHTSRSLNSFEDED